MQAKDGKFMRKDMQKKLLIIIPAYNEEKNIGDTLDGLTAAGIREWADILVMNDASRDGTEDAARQRGCQVVNHIFNLGYGSGLQIGYKYAVRENYEYVIQMDADGQHAVSNVKKIYDRLLAESEGEGRPDIVLGSRFLPGSETYPISLVKKIAYSFFRILIRLGTGKKIKDPTTGLQGLSRRAFTYYAQYSHFDDQYPDANMIMQMLLLGFSVVEMPALMFARHEGVSMHHGIIKPLIYMFRMIYSIIAVWLRIRLFKVEKRV